MTTNASPDKHLICCPHCNDFIWVEEINCAIFRHGVMKQTGIQIDPHANEVLCNRLINNNLIHGCGKPFRVIQNTKDGSIKGEICGYE